MHILRIVVRWDPAKAAANLKKHGIDFADAATAFTDDRAITIPDRIAMDAPGKRGAILPTAPGKTRITIRIDDDILEWFRERVHEAGGGSYQNMINRALRDHIDGQSEELEETRR